MKKLILTLTLVVMTLAASANTIRYFTRSQAARVAKTLDAENELMIYCGYEYELATYVIVNEVWMEPVNSKYYEIWLYGFDAYTGEEIYMPIDLSCIWLYNYTGHRMYSAAHLLRFRSTVATPNFYWTMPPYNPYTRYYHDPHYGKLYTYHYEIHRYGWRPPMHHHDMMHYHPYYMRTPHTPAPVPHAPFTPGVDYPRTADGHGYIGSGSRNTIGGTRNTTGMSNGGTRSNTNFSNPGNRGTTNRGNVTTTTNNGSNGRGTTTTTTNSSNNNRGTTTTTTNNGNNGRGTTTTTTNNGSNNRGTTTTTTNNGNNGRGTATTTTNNSNNNRGTTTTTTNNGRGTTTTTTNNGSNNRGTTTTTTTRSTSTTTTRSSTTSRGNSTTSRTTTKSTSSSTGRDNSTTNSGTNKTR